MEKVHQSIQINAPVAKVWDTMLNEETYKQWASEFSPDGYYKGDWNQGSKIVFLGPDPQTGEESGMIGRIAENRLHEFVSVEYLGVYGNGVEDTTSEEAKKWTPSFENYTFTETDGVTEVLVEIDVPSDYKSMFDEMWPKALAKLKEICEA